jgi:toxin ParE1/3/4
MKYSVFVLLEAKQDLLDIYQYVAEHDSVMRADSLLDALEEMCAQLSENPQRGHQVPELKRVYVGGFREVHCKPFRIVFQVSAKNVYIHAVLDGRRDLQDFLESRVLR